MEILNNWISGINDLLWSYVLIIMLLGCAFRFTFKTRFVQFRMFREMIRVLGDSANKAHEGEKHISSFQAFAVSLASRVGTGNLAGVATAVAVGGPGAVFWMWIIALLGSASAFVESTLAQLYKRKGKESFIGGPAYYMRYGLGLNWMGILFAILISVTFGFAFNSVQSNTICAAMQGSFGFDPRIVGAVLTVLTLAIIFGGIQRIAKVSSVIVPVMALGYVALASGIVLFNITELPAVIKLIVSSAFGWEQAAGGTIGAALMQGIKRGLFSNEAGMGSAPNVAATASVTHPVKQGLIQTLGVFTDTLLICTCTAFIILFSGAPLDGSVNGVQLTQHALTLEVGKAGGIFVAVAIFLFAFSSIIGNYYYGEANIRFITPKKSVLYIYRLAVGGMVMFGALASLELAWSLADITMAFMTICNLFAISLLSKQAFLLLHDYIAQKRSGIKSPVFDKNKLPESWPISYRSLRFQVKPMNFKHTGLFPEQAANWDFAMEQIRQAGRPIRVLNLFAYTGGATVACAAAGASVCHVDAAKGMVAWAKENARVSGLQDAPIRWIVDDCAKFVEREIRRGKTYDAIIMDPPSYGRGPGGEVWKLEENLYPFVKLCARVLSDKPLFVILNSYTTGLAPSVLGYILQMLVGRRFGGRVTWDELGLPCTDSGMALPCGATGRWMSK